MSVQHYGGIIINEINAQPVGRPLFSSWISKLCSVEFQYLHLNHNL